MQIRDTAISTVFLLILLVAGRWAWTRFGSGPEPDGPLGYFTWAAYFAGGVLAFSVAGSLLGLLWSRVERIGRSEEIAREARMEKADAYFFYVDGDVARGPFQMTRIRIVPALALIDVEFRALQEPVPEQRLAAMRAIVSDAVERIKREMAPEAWVQSLPGALAELAAHGLVLRESSPGYHWYDPQEISKAATSDR